MKSAHQLQNVNSKMWPVIGYLIISLFVSGWFSAAANAQQSSTQIEVLPMGNWIKYRQAQYRGEPILVHLRTGYERAVLMPEPVRLENPEAALPGCTVVVEGDIVGFYPTSTFTRRPIRFVGETSGDIYELRVRASDSGIRQPLQINRR